MQHPIRGDSAASDLKQKQEAHMAIMKRFEPHFLAPFFPLESLSWLQRAPTHWDANTLPVLTVCVLVNAACPGFVSFSFSDVEARMRLEQQRFERDVKLKAQKRSDPPP